MGFVGVYKVLYDYTPQADSELPISEGDLLYVLEKSDVDDWWKAKRKAGAEDEDEPVGLVPNNYVEEVRYPAPSCSARPAKRASLTLSAQGPTHRCCPSLIRIHETNRRGTLLSRGCCPTGFRYV